MRSLLSLFLLPHGKERAIEGVRLVFPIKQGVAMKVEISPARSRVTKL